MTRKGGVGEERTPLIDQIRKGAFDGLPSISTSEKR